MNQRLALMSLLLLPLLAACSREEPAADAAPAPAPTTEAPAAEAPPATDTAAAAQADAAATGSDAEADTQAPTAPPAPPIYPNAGASRDEGRDYDEKANGQPYAPRYVKVEVVEILGYV
jgi:thiol:disulfide interchange protein DsbA